MIKENRLIILWVIFGFILVTAIAAVVSSLTYAILFISVISGLSLSILNFAIPTISIVLYGLTAYLIIRKINNNSAQKGIHFTEFPKKTLVIAAFIAFILNGVTNKLNGLAFEKMAAFNEHTDALSLYGITDTGLGVSKWIVVIVIAWTYLKNIQTKHNNT